MTNQELLQRYYACKTAFDQIAMVPHSVIGWGHSQQLQDWLDCLCEIKNRFPQCEYPASQAEFYLQEDTNKS